MPIKKIIPPWTDGLIVDAKAEYVFIRPRAGVVSTEEDWRQAKLYAPNLKVPHGPRVYREAPASTAPISPQPELPADFEIIGFS
jgi:hypothetical protein